MKKFLVIIVLVINTPILFGQFGINGGVSVLKGFGVPKPFVGFHFGAEIPRSDIGSIYARISIYGKQNETIKQSTYVTAIDLTTNPYSQNISYVNSMNYTILEGGNRYYIGNGYDSGFGAYGGGNFLMAFNTVKRKYDDYDQAKYALPTGETPKGSIFNLGVGLGGGVKHTLAGIGTLYLDANFSYLILATASNTTASMSNLHSQMLFTFNFGFRKDFY